MVDPTTCVYQLIYDENEKDDTELIQFYYAWNRIMHQGI